MKKEKHDVLSAMYSDRGISLYHNQAMVCYLQEKEYPSSLTYEDIYRFHLLTLKYLCSVEQILKVKDSNIGISHICELFEIKSDTVAKMMKRFDEYDMIRYVENQKAYMVNPLYAFYSRGIRISVYEEFSSEIRKSFKVPELHIELMDNFVKSGKKGKIDLKKSEEIIYELNKKNYPIGSRHFAKRKRPQRPSIINKTKYKQKTHKRKKLTDKEDLKVFQGEGEKLIYKIFAYKPAIAYPDKAFYETNKISNNYKNIGKFHLLCRKFLSKQDNSLTWNTGYIDKFSMPLTEAYINYFFTNYWQDDDSNSSLLKFIKKKTIRIVRLQENRFMVNPSFCIYISNHRLTSYNAVKLFKECLMNHPKIAERIKVYEILKGYETHLPENVYAQIPKAKFLKDLISKGEYIFDAIVLWYYKCKSLPPDFSDHQDIVKSLQNLMISHKLPLDRILRTIVSEIDNEHWKDLNHLLNDIKNTYYKNKDYDKAIKNQPSIKVKKIPEERLSIKDSTFKKINTGQRLQELCKSYDNFNAIVTWYYEGTQQQENFTQIKSITMLKQLVIDFGNSLDEIVQHISMEMNNKKPINLTYLLNIYQKSKMSTDNISLPS